MKTIQQMEHELWLKEQRVNCWENFGFLVVEEEDEIEWLDDEELGVAA